MPLLEWMQPIRCTPDALVVGEMNVMKMNFCNTSGHECSIGQPLQNALMAKAKPITSKAVEEAEEIGKKFNVRGIHLAQPY
jgi:hypothetical protein